MKKHFITVCLIILSLGFLAHANAQHPELSWSNLFGDPENPQSGNAVLETTDGGYIVAGTKNIIDSLDHNDVYILRLDSEGNELWNKTYGGEYSVQGSSICQANDGGFLIAGSIKLVSGAKADAWVLRINADGDSLWSGSFGGTSADQAYCIRPTSDNGFIVTGFNSVPAAGLGDQVLLIKLDSLGNYDWNETYGDQYQNHGYWVEETSDGGYIIAGRTYRSYTGNSDWLVIKTSSEGDSLWSYIYGLENDDVAFRVMENTADDNYLVVGNLTVVVGMADKDYYYFPFGVDCLDRDGNLLWQEIYGLYKPHNAYDASLTHDGNLMVGGTSFDPDWTHSDIFLYEIDAGNGDSLWMDTFGDYVNENASTFLQTSDFGYIISGKAGNPPANRLIYVMRLVHSNATTSLIKRNLDIDLELIASASEDQLSMICEQKKVYGITVTLDTLRHPSVGDLEIILEHKGTSAILASKPANSGTDFLGTIFFDGATRPVSSGSAPYTGFFKPVQALSTFNEMDPNGDWTLRIIDHAVGGTKKSGEKILDTWGIKLLVDKAEATFIGNPEAGDNFILKPNYPNPFNDHTSIDFELTEPSFVRISIYDAGGRLVQELINRDYSSGEHRLIWEAGKQTPGSYIIRLEAGKHLEYRKIILVK
jgi:subtilisin-like proprotein convertase family protein